MTDDETIRVRRALADLLRARRIALGITQEEVAQKAGAAQANISMLERGATFPSIPRLLLLARILQIDVGDLARLDREDDNDAGRAA